MTNQVITKSYETQSGKTVTITGTLILSKTTYCDGDNIEIPCCDISYTWALDGLALSGSWIRSTDGLLDPDGKYSPVDYPYLVDRLLITPEGYAVYRAIKSTLESHPAWQAKEAQIEKNKAEAEQLEQSRKANGYCYKCGSYCYGDCTA